MLRCDDAWDSLASRERLVVEGSSAVSSSEPLSGSGLKSSSETWSSMEARSAAASDIFVIHPTLASKRGALHCDFEKRVALRCKSMCNVVHMPFALKGNACQLFPYNLKAARATNLRDMSRRAASLLHDASSSPSIACLCTLQSSMTMVTEMQVQVLNNANSMSLTTFERWCCSLSCYDTS